MTIDALHAPRRTLLRKPDVLAALGDSNTQFYDKINRGLVSRPIKIGARAAAWPSDEIAAIQNARVAGRSADEIRALVAELHAKRTAGATP